VVAWRGDECVRAIAAAPLPDRIWSTSEPAAMVMRSDSPNAWTTMMLHGDRFDRLHNAGVLVRSLGGVQTDLPGAAPSSLTGRYRNWHTAQLEFEQLRRIAKPPRLRWTIEHDWQPASGWPTTSTAARIRRPSASCSAAHEPAAERAGSEGIPAVLTHHARPPRV
jgi:hypothetical protein